MKEKVTIAIASYNNSHYIERCIDSVLCQSYTNLDVLIVDDGSTDDTIPKLSRYKKDRRVRIITKENGGLSSVRQIALDNAKGDFISFIDADDYIAVDFVQTMLQKLLYDHSDICVCSTRFENKEGKYLYTESKTLSCHDSDKPIKVSLDFISDPNEHFSLQFFLSDSWNKMYKLSFLRESGVAFNMPKGLNGTDTMFNRRLLLRCPIYSTVSKAINYHVIYNSSAAHRRGKDLLGSAMFMTSQILFDIDQLGIKPLMSKWVSYFYYQRLLGALSDVYQESSFFYAFAKIKNEYTRHKAFINENNLKSLSIGEIRSKEMKSFLFTLMYFRCLLPLYLRIHRVIFK